MQPSAAALGQKGATKKKLNRAGGTFPLHSAQLVATAMCVVAAVTSLLAPFATRGSRGCVLSLVQVPPH